VSRRLDSWKEIASHLGRGIRTVQRWEREEGLPVHRLDHVKRGTVYANPEELDAWWESRRRSAPPETSAAPAVPRSLPQLERVTNTTAVTFWPALSPDARLIAYLSDAGRDGETPQIWLQQIGGAAIRVTSDLRGCSDVSFSADGTRILFSARADASLNVYDMPAFGGAPRLLKRSAHRARPSPDGRSLAYISLEPPHGIRVSRADGSGDRIVDAGLTDVSFVIWLPTSDHLLVHAHADAGLEPDYWVVALDGGPAVNTGVLQRLRTQNLWALSSPPHWHSDALVLSAVGRDGLGLYRQRLQAESYKPQGAAEPLSRATESGWFPAGAGGRLAFVSAQPDMNLWSIGIDSASGQPFGPLRRLTRGPGILAHLSVTADGRTLAYFVFRSGKADLVLRDLDTGAETIISPEPVAADRGYPVLSPSGRQLAFGVRMPGPGPVASRPVFVADLLDGRSRQLRENCGGRPRQWVDERYLLIETFGSRLNRFLVLDTTDGSQRDGFACADRTLSNPRVSPDGRWLAFDATRPGGVSQVVVAPLTTPDAAPESQWMVVDDAGSHPFWSRDGRILYYLAMTPSAELRGEIRARRIDPSTGLPDGDSFSVLALREMVASTLVTGIAPIAAPDQLLLILGDFRGDIWMMDLEG
jgi:Tol biopolymer transport system component